MRRFFVVTALVMGVLAMAGFAGSPQSARATTTEWYLPANSVPGTFGTIELAGETVLVTATGSANWGPGEAFYGPNGGGGVAPDGVGYMLPGANFIALLGRVGGGPWFLVGEGPIEISGTGLLEFVVNDTLGHPDWCPLPGTVCFDNNEGGHTITISPLDPKPTEVPTEEPVVEPTLDVEVNIHVRECPAGATLVYEECHPYGIPGVGLDLVYADDPSIVASDVTNDDGNARFYGFAGGWLLYVTIDDAYTYISAYCALEENIGQEIFIDLSLPILVDSGDVVYCDIYFTAGNTKIDDGASDDGGKKDDHGDGKKHDGGKKGGKKGDGGDVALPDTGSGSASGPISTEQTLLLAIALTGALGIAAAHRRSRRAEG